MDRPKHGQEIPADAKTVEQIRRGECPICGGELIKHTPTLYECTVCTSATKPDDEQQYISGFTPSIKVVLEIMRLDALEEATSTATQMVKDVRKELGLNQDQTIKLCRYWKRHIEERYGKSLL